MPGIEGFADIFRPDEDAWLRSAPGHEDAFPPPRLGVCYVIRQETFAGASGDDPDAPKADHPVNAVEPIEKSEALP